MGLVMICCGMLEVSVREMEVLTVKMERVTVTVILQPDRLLA
jgi:hypothetical protein